MIAHKNYGADAFLQFIEAQELSKKDDKKYDKKCNVDS